jgi:predicted nucleic acid-binding protein
MIRAFVDASVFFSACYSETGASFEIFRECLIGNIDLVISHFVLEEVRRNLARKAPESFKHFDEFMENVQFHVVNPSKRAVLQAASYTELKDAPIVAAAKKSKADYLVSLDRQHLVEAPLVHEKSGLTIVLPEELLQHIRASRE